MVKKPNASVSKITFSGEQEFCFEPNEKVIIVGPNNSGKSQTLREIVKYASEGESARPVVLKSLEVKKTGTSDELTGYLEEHASIVDKHYRYKDWNFYTEHTRLWDRPFLQHNLAPGFIKNIDANNRLTICQL